MGADLAGPERRRENLGSDMEPRGGGGGEGPEASAIFRESRLGSLGMAPGQEKLVRSWTRPLQSGRETRGPPDLPPKDTQSLPWLPLDSSPGVLRFTLKRKKKKIDLSHFQSVDWEACDFSGKPPTAPSALEGTPLASLALSHRSYPL